MNEMPDAEGRADRVSETDARDTKDMRDTARRTSTTPGAPQAPGESGASAVREARGSEPAQASAPAAAKTAVDAGRQAAAHGSPLVPRDESDKLAARLEHAVLGFVDGPRDAVTEADRVLEELANRLTDAMDRRRRTLRGSWQETEGGAKDGGTEQLRLALRDYRELTERLLHV